MYDEWFGAQNSRWEGPVPLGFYRRCPSTLMKHCPMGQPLTDW
jgi:hypothetical protein